jgi:hypothetical protein
VTHPRLCPRYCISLSLKLTAVTVFSFNCSKCFSTGMYFQKRAGRVYSAYRLLRAGRPKGRSSSPGRVKKFLFTSSRPALGSTQLPIQWVPGFFFSGLKRQGREADHSPPASAEVKKIWIYTSTPLYAFVA